MRNLEELNVSHVLKDTFLDYMRECKNGIVTVPLPTGVGKTYSSCQAIAEYLIKDKEARNIVWITTLKKNLPNGELQRAFAQYGADAKDYVLEFKSNMDYILEAFDSGLLANIPNKLKDKNYTEMITNIKYINQLRKKEVKSPLDKKQLKSLTDEFMKQERKFRLSISRMLKSYCHDQKCKALEAIEGVEEFRFIGEIYPAVFWRRYKVILLTMKKLLDGFIPFVENVGCLSEDFLQDRIVFIDEYDATKKTIISDAIQSNRYIIDSLKLFLVLRQGMHSPTLFSRMPTAALEKMKSSRRFSAERITKEADRIFQRYHLDLSYRTPEDVDRNIPTFLYYCSTFSTLAPDNRKAYVWIQEDDKDNRMQILHGDKEEFNNNFGEKHTLNAMVTDIDVFNRYFAIFVSLWALQYCKVVNARRKSGDAELSYTNAVESILQKFKLSEQQEQVLESDYHLKRKLTIKEFRSPYSYFTDGFSYYRLEDSDRHADDTIISMLKYNETPEAIMTYIARNALVFAVSATSTCPSVFCNYSLEFLRREFGDDYHDMVSEHPKLEASVKRELAHRYEPYGKEVKIEPVSVLPQTYKESEVSGMLKGIFKKYAYAKQCMSVIRSKLPKVKNNDTTSQDYLEGRYINLLRVLHDFASHTNHQTLLVLGMRLPADADDSPLRKDVLEKLADYVNRDLGINKSDDGIRLEVLDSSDFDRRWSKISMELAEGKRIAVISTYETVGDGQNLVYPVSKKYEKELVRLPANDKRSFDMRDIDEIYLGNITNFVTNTSDRSNFGLDQLFLNCIQAEEAYYNCEISMAVKDAQVREGFRAIAYPSDDGRSNLLYNTPSANSQITRYVIQGCGRQGRTLNRNRSINIYIDEKVLGRLDIGYLKKIEGFLSPEMKALMTASMNMGNEEQTVSNHYNLEASLISMSGRSTINQLLGASINLWGKSEIYWSESTHDWWVEFHQTALRHPTAGDKERDESQIIDEYYISKGGELIDSYYYTGDTDYSDIRVSLDGKQPLEKKKRLEAAVIHEVSMKNARLAMMLRYPGMREYFKGMGYATGWFANKYMMSPVVYNNVYLGALGEAVGKRILQQDSIIKIREIEDLSKFEAFDFMVKDAADVYIDFKHYKASCSTLDEERWKIEKKMEIIGAKRVFIVGIIEPGTPTEPFIPIDGKIYMIPYLMHRDGSPAHEMIELLTKKIYSDIENNL